MSNECLNLTRVLQDEYTYINDFYPQGVSTWEFKKDHLIDPAKLVLHLQEVEQTRDPLTLRILNKLPREARAQLKQYTESDTQPPESLLNYIVDALNELLRDPDLQNTPRLPPEWTVEAQARALKDVSGSRDGDEPSREVTRDATYAFADDDLFLEITQRAQRDTPPETASREIKSFNRRLLEIAFRDELAQIQNTLSAVYGHIHRKKPAALCLSGGGVRSATFSLGIIQALADRGFLGKFSYLSTVSGGGFIGGWLSAWSYRHPQGLRGVISELKNTHNPTSNAAKGTEPETVTRLRTTSNYLTPKLGVFSGDSWALIGTYLRNLFLNWLVLVPLIAAAVTLPKLHVGFIQFLDLTASPYANPLVGHATIVVGLFLLVVAAVYIGLNRPSMELSLRGDQSYGLLGLMPLVVGAVWFVSAFYGSQFGYPLQWWQFVVIGVGLKLIVWLVQLPAQVHSHGPGGQVPLRQDVEVIWEGLAAIVSGALGGVLVWSVSTLFNARLPNGTSSLSYACFAAPLLLLLLIVTEGLFIGLVSKWTTDEDREWWARAGGWVLLTAIGWATLNAIVLYGPYLFPQAFSPEDRLSHVSEPNRLVETLKALFLAIGGPLSGILTILIGKGAATPAQQEAETQATKMVEKLKSFKPALSEWSLKLAMPVFIVFLIALVSVGVDWVTWLAWSRKDAPLKMLTSLPSIPVDSYKYWYPWPVLLILFFGFIVTGLLMARVIDPNKFSLNAGYRSRLIRAYLGASRNYRKPNPFTGFDRQDNLPLYQLAEPNRYGFFNKNLFHVLNLTLNLVAGENLAWQERKAESFTMSPLHCGNHNTGYRSSTEYGRASCSASGNDPANRPPDQIPERELPMTLGFAMSLSGAAASPNMGYHTSKPLAFLLTLFNVRLGGWLTNPGKCGDRARGKLYSYFALLYELFGLTDDKSPYVYLSDGGHFENLGLYEMVLRRCHQIVVIDAGHDPKCSFADLGKAIHKIRTDLGIPIEFSAINIHSREDKTLHEKQTYCAIGSIGYSNVDDEAENGRLLYIKPAFYEEGNEPRDVYEYANRCPQFPHDSTADQWFGESQFESYRALGGYIFHRIAGDAKDVSIEQLFDSVEQTLANKDQKQPAEIQNLLGMTPWTAWKSPDAAGLR